MNTVDTIIDFYSSLSDEEKIKNQLLFLEKIFPSIDKKLKYNEREIELLNNRLNSMISSREKEKEYFYQYKGKIQRIEEFLISNGLIKLLGKTIKE